MVRRYVTSLTSSQARYSCAFFSLILLKLYRLSSIICWFKKFNMNNYSVQREVKWAFSSIIYGLRKFQITRHSKSFNTSLFIRLAAADLPDISIRPRFLPMILFSLSRFILFHLREKISNKNNTTDSRSSCLIEIEICVENQRGILDTWTLIHNRSIHMSVSCVFSVQI